MRGKVYGVGVGPGDKELITLKAVRILKESDIVALPVTAGGDKVAYDIVKDYIKDKPTLQCPMPMNKSFDELNKNYEAVADNIEKELRAGKIVAFITLGDPTVYSTYMQVNTILKERGCETELIPGVPSFCAAAARLNMSLCERGEPLIILPASYKEVEEGLRLKGTKVLMKANRAILQVRDILKKQGKINKSVMVECCGMENEKIYTDLNSLQEKTDYFSVVIVKD